eukprot:gene25762-31517_t
MSGSVSLEPASGHVQVHLEVGQEVKAVLCSSAPEPCAAADDAPAAREVEMIVSQ